MTSINEEIEHEVMWFFNYMEQENPDITLCTQSIDDIRRWVKEFYFDVMDCLRSHWEKTAAKVIEKIMENL